MNRNLSSISTRWREGGTARVPVFHLIAGRRMTAKARENERAGLFGREASEF